MLRVMAVTVVRQDRPLRAFVSYTLYDSWAAARPVRRWVRHHFVANPELIERPAAQTFTPWLAT